MKSITEKDLETLQRYNETIYPTIGWYHIEKDDKWEFVKWYDIIELLK